MPVPAAHEFVLFVPVIRSLFAFLIVLLIVLVLLKLLS